MVQFPWQKKRRLDEKVPVQSDVRKTSEQSQESFYKEHRDAEMKMLQEKIKKKAEGK